jgi:hypothetical protein
MINLNPVLYATIALLVCTYCVESYKYVGGSEPDYIRAEYITLEKNLLEKYVNRDSVSKNYKLYSVIDQHSIFFKKYLFNRFDENHFNILRRFYEFNLIEKNFMEMDTLFEATRQYIEDELKVGDKVTGGFDEQRGLDLAETTLHDPQWPINNTMEQLNTIIVGQGLYYRAISVGVLENSQQSSLIKNSLSSY